MYYAAVSHDEQYEKVTADSYLGIQLRGKLTTHDLGKKFEAWVDEANEKFNSFLTTGNLSELNSIQGTLGSYYKAQGASMLSNTTPDERESYRMKVSPKFQLSIKPPINVNPDGLFPYGRFGAIFESKLSEPKHLEFVHQAAICALASEKLEQVDVNYAVVLHSNYPDQQPSSYFKEISDSAIDRVTSNLESFLHLLQSSEIQRIDSDNRSPKGNTGIVDLIKRTLSLFYHSRGNKPKSWKDFVIRPTGLPERELRGPCPRCRYKEACFEDGNEPGGWTTP